MKAVNHRLQELLFSEVLHLPLDGTDSTGSKRGLALISIFAVVQDIWQLG